MFYHGSNELAIFDPSLNSKTRAGHVIIVGMLLQYSKISETMEYAPCDRCGQMSNDITIIRLHINARWLYSRGRHVEHKNLKSEKGLICI